LLQRGTFALHPYAGSSRARREYRELGEIAFLEQKERKFWQAVRDDPVDFLERLASRFLGVLLWYEPLDRTAEAQCPWIFWLSRVTYPLAFLAMLVVTLTALHERLDAIRGTVIGIYTAYLLPYIAISYYERYAVPLLGVKALLIVWAADRLPCGGTARPPLPRGGGGAGTSSRAHAGVTR